MTIQSASASLQTTATLQARPKNIVYTAGASISASVTLTCARNASTKTAVASLAAVVTVTFRGGSQAALTTSTQLICITGFAIERQSQIDPDFGSVRALPRPRTWLSLAGTTWATFTKYGGQNLPIIWTSDIIDLGEVRDFCLEITTATDGQITKYQIAVSDSQAFAGEESLVEIQDGNSNVASFRGQYVRVKTYCSGSQMTSQDIQAQFTPVTRKLYDINTSTLTGTAANRVLTIDPPLGNILRMDISVKAATSYAVNLYVSDTANSEVLIPVVKSKSAAAPSFALYGIDNDARNGVVDIEITAMPRQMMAGNNLYVIT